MNEVHHTVGFALDKPARHWPARLDLKFGLSGGKPRLTHNEHCGPLRVQRLLYPEQQGKAHCHLLHPPRGLVLGDELTINITLGNGETRVTPPSAGRFYSVANEPQAQVQTVSLSVNSGHLEWLPQETIIFEGTNARLNTRINLSGDAQLGSWDVIVLGKPASGEDFRSGHLEQSLEISRNGRPLRVLLQLVRKSGYRRDQAGSAWPKPCTKNPGVTTGYRDPDLRRRTGTGRRGDGCQPARSGAGVLSPRTPTYPSIQILNDREEKA